MVEHKFEKHLQDVKEMFGFRGSREIKYAHSVHQRYMLEVPASLVAGDKRPPDFELVRTSNS